jgi:hypothetical protein
VCHRKRHLLTVSQISQNLIAPPSLISPPTSLCCLLASANPLELRTISVRVGVEKHSGDVGGLIKVSKTLEGWWGLFDVLTNTFFLLPASPSCPCTFTFSPPQPPSSSTPPPMQKHPPCPQRCNDAPMKFDKLPLRHVSYLGMPAAAICVLLIFSPPRCTNDAPSCARVYLLMLLTNSY